MTSLGLVEKANTTFTATSWISLSLSLSGRSLLGPPVASSSCRRVRRQDGGVRVSAGGRATAVVVARTVIRARTTHGDSPASGREASGAVVEEDGVATPCASRNAAHTRCLPSAHSARGVRCTCVVNDHVCAQHTRTAG